MTKNILDQLHDSVATDLLNRIKSGEASASELSVAVKFLKDNGATQDVIHANTPVGNLLENLPFDIEELQ
tara:strand:+ start:802 stop:1011 length:210 start_codon:yes stop_codon:yes gene_type:complete